MTDLSPQVEATDEQQSLPEVVRSLGIDIANGPEGILRARRIAAAASEYGALWSRVLMLGHFSRSLPLARPRAGVMILSGWASPDDRQSFRAGPSFSNVVRSTRVASLDLGPGIARSQHRHLTLSDDGWIQRLPAGKAPRGTVAVLTYARLSPRGVRPFQRLARSVTLSARESDGFIASAFATDFRAPALRVMSLTLWELRSYASQWAYSGDTHPKAISWLFESPNLMPGGCVARFPILAAEGWMDGVDLEAALGRIGDRTSAT